jgi:predicted dehydrogenase
MRTTTRGRPARGDHLFRAGRTVPEVVATTGVFVKKPPVTVALVGISGYGAFYVDTLLDDPRFADLRLAGIVDPAAQRCRRLGDLLARGCRVHPSLASLLDATPELDLVAIAAPTHLHARMTCAALTRGVNVLCEKPLAGSLSDALSVSDVHRTSTAFAAIGYQWSFSAAVQHLKQDIMAGLLGQPLRMRSIASYPRGQAYFTRNDWAGRVATTKGDFVNDSPLNNATAHFLHNMLYLLGPTRETSATPARVQAELYRANAIENYDTAALRCETSEGVEILFYTTHAEARSIGPATVLEFTNATVTYDRRAGACFAARFADGRVKDYGNPDHDRRQPLLQCVDAVRTGDRIACGVEAAIAQTICMAAAQSSPIVDFPAAVQLTSHAAEGPMTAIEGLGDALARGYDVGLLPSELPGLPWSRPAPVVDATAPLDQPSRPTATMPA